MNDPMQVVGKRRKFLNSCMRTSLESDLSPQKVFISLMLYSHLTLGIAITQPRRLAAVNVANRVAQEMGVQVVPEFPASFLYPQHGGLVGHHVRFDRTVSSETRITFLTDGILVH